jgi:uncharacterized protein (TIGR00251 family)
VTSASSTCYEHAPEGGIVLTVRLTPKGGRDFIDGVAHLADGRAVLKVRVRAAPSGGEANDALAKILARSLGVAPSAVALVAGATSRIKRIRIDGDAATLAAALEQFAGVDA